MPSDHEPSPRVVSLHEGGLAARLGREPLALAFAPIAALDDGAVAGYEALLGSAADPEGPREAPAAWSRQGHGAQAGAIEARLVREALGARERLPPGAYLLLKVSTRALLDPALVATLEAAADLRGVVVAVSDDADSADTLAVGRAVGRLREAGARFAVDDAGGGSASLDQVVRLRPDLVRVGRTFTVEIDREPARAAVVEALVAVASRIDAQVIAAEIPGVAELHALMRIGVPFAQGPVLGDPVTPEPGELTPEARAAVVAGRIPRRAERTVAGALEPLEPLEQGMSDAAIADRFLADPRHDALVAVDLEGRPVALLDRAAMLRGERYAAVPMTVGPDAPLPEIARRATARATDDRLRPLVVCDADGRYLGIVRIERLLDALAAPGGRAGGRSATSGEDGAVPDERRRGPSDRRA